MAQGFPLLLVAPEENEGAVLRRALDTKVQIVRAPESDLPVARVFSRPLFRSQRKSIALQERQTC